MIHKCGKCGEEKEFNTDNFKSNKIKGKLYLEKVCKVCRNKSASIRAKERYRTDEQFKNKKLLSTETKRLKNQKEKNKLWKKRIERGKIWKQQNIHKIKAKYAERHKRRWSDPNYRISKNMSNSINNRIADKDYSHWCEFVGYSVQELMEHLEKLFLDGMSWDNYGEWHIDHIKPVCSFNITSKDCEDFKLCWSLSNLRPLWAKDNLIKSTEDKKLSIKSSRSSRKSQDHQELSEPPQQEYFSVVARAEVI